MPLNIGLWRERKKQKGYTFSDLERISNVPKRTIEDIFAERTPTPRIDTVIAIEKALGIENVYQLENDGKETPSDNLSEGKRQWLYLYDHLSNSNIKLIYEMVKSLLPEEQPYLANIATPPSTPEC